MLVGLKAVEVSLGTTTGVVLVVLTTAACVTFRILSVTFWPTAASDEEKLIERDKPRARAVVGSKPTLRAVHLWQDEAVERWSCWRKDE